jgi:hypothetical protein
LVGAFLFARKFIFHNLQNALVANFVDINKIEQVLKKIKNFKKVYKKC